MARRFPSDIPEQTPEQNLVALDAELWDLEFGESWYPTKSEREHRMELLREKIAELRESIVVGNHSE
jgi:hypothetical protein